MTKTGAGAGSVEAGERIRLFCALQLDDETVERLVAWQEEHLPGAAGRPVPRENLHVTLAFLGHRPAAELPAIARELRAAAAGAGRIELRALRYRETRSVGMIVLEDVRGTATALAEEVQARLERLGAYRREHRPWLPHLTVLRSNGRAGVAPPVANTCSIHVVRAAVYRSVLGAGGARYEVVETGALGG